MPDANLDIYADLSLDVDGEQIHIDGQGETVVVDLPRLRAGRKLLASSPFRRRLWRGLADADALLRRAGVTLDVRLRGRSLGRLGVDGRRGGIARLLLGSGDDSAASRSRRTSWLAVSAAFGLAALAGAWLSRRGRHR